MINNILSQFSIKDLENLSGIKAHTIRIWEKRYNMLEPDRTASNIRYYNLENLKKLLNVKYLYNKGEKISKIASLDNEGLYKCIREYSSKSKGTDHFLDSFKIAMLNFDQSLFDATYNRIIAETSFKHVFLEVFVPLLQQIGLQWLSNGITPAHEHFISHLIKQKLHINIGRIQQTKPEESDTTFVLFLPSHEIHELGLLYIHYELTLKGYHSIYLGQSVPRSSLKSLQKIYPKIQFIGYFTVYPSPEGVQEYLDQIKSDLFMHRDDSLWILGRSAKEASIPSDWKDFIVFNDIGELLELI